MSESKPCKHPCIIWVAGQLPYCVACEQFIIEPVRVILTGQEAPRTECDHTCPPTCTNRWHAEVD